MSAPLDDIRTMIRDLPAGPFGLGAGHQASLGRLGEMAAWFEAWSATPRPQVRRPILALYAGAPGPGRLAESEEKRATLEAIAAGGAPASKLAASMGAGLEAFDLAIDRPIGDVASGAGLGERECAATMAFGMEVLAKQPDLLILGHVGACALGEGFFGPGEALERLKGYAGREVAAAAGAIMGARSQKVPVILDGEAACAAAVILEAARPGLSAHCLLAAPPPSRLQDALDMIPLLDLGPSSAEGANGLAAAALVRLAAGAAAS